LFAWSKKWITNNSYANSNLCYSIDQKEKQLKA